MAMPPEAIEVLVEEYRREWWAELARRVRAFAQTPGPHEFVTVQPDALREYINTLDGPTTWEPR